MKNPIHADRAKSSKDLSSYMKRLAVSKEEVFKLLGILYDSVHDSALMPVFFRELLLLLKGATSVLFLEDLRRPKPVFDTLICWDPRISRLYGKQSPQNTWLIRSEPIITAGVGFSDDLLLVEEELIWSEFNNLHMDSETNYGNMTVLRSKRSRSFHTEDLEFLAGLMPHVERALRFHQTIIDLRMEHSLVSELLNCLPVGLILLNEKGKVSRLNHAAQTILENKDGLILIDNEIRALKSKENSALQEMITFAMTTGFESRYPGGARLLIYRPCDLHPLFCSISPISVHDHIPGSEKSKVVIFLNDPERKVSISEEHLRKLYGLTKAESRLTLRLLDGKGLKQAAIELKISYNTAKRQVAEVFQKTRTGKQSELVRLLLGGSR